MIAPLSENESFEAEVENLSFGGQGICRPKGFTVFVSKTVPGDHIKARVTSLRRRYAFASLEKILIPSKNRIEPKCEYNAECGGCHYQQCTESVERNAKKGHIEDALKKFGPSNFHVLDIRHANNAWNYRNRLTYHRDASGRQGYFHHNTQRGVVDIRSCPIADTKLNDLWELLREECKEIDPQLMPYVVLRSSTLGERAILLSLTSRNAMKDLSRWVQKISGKIGTKTGIFLTWIPPNTHSPFGKEMTHVFGPERLTEKVGDLLFPLRPHLFFQINPNGYSLLLEEMTSWAKSLKEKKVMDLYCGSGFFSLPLSKAGFSVLGVEISHESILVAKEAAALNGLDATFRAGKAETILHRLIRDREQFPNLVVDPPRKGLHKTLPRFFLDLKVENILYISCSPPTFARDAKLLEEFGYKLRRVQPLDLFPKTYHVEVASTFERS